MFVCFRSYPPIFHTMKYARCPELFPPGIFFGINIFTLLGIYGKKVIKLVQMECLWVKMAIFPTTITHRNKSIL